MGLSVDKTTHSVTAWISREDISEDGVLFSTGDRFSGASFYIKDNRLKYVYNYAKEEYYTAVSDIELPEGDIKVQYTFAVEDGKSADVKLYINDQEAGSTRVKQFYYMKGFVTTLRADKYTPVTPDYEVPFEFKGKLKRIVIHTAGDFVNTEEEIQKFLSVE